MTEDQSSVASKEKEKIPDFDIVLSVLISSFAEYGIGIGVTLNVKGLIISGELISREKYFKGIIQETERANGDSEMIKIVTDTFTTMDKIIKDKLSEKEKKPFPNYIHLKNARFFPGGNCTPNNKGVLWRGRLSEVDGFSIGNLSPQTK
ncbi:MAG: gas vesicle accessory protein GvpU [Cyanobacteria bacterium J06629_2]